MAEQLIISFMLYFKKQWLYQMFQHHRAFRVRKKHKIIIESPKKIWAKSDAIQVWPFFIQIYNAVDGCEILHQLVDGTHPIIILLFTVFYRTPNRYQLVQDFFHPQYFYRMVWTTIIPINYSYIYHKS